MGRTLRIGIAGKRGLSFVAGLRAFPEVQIAAFCERDPQAVAQGAQTHDIPLCFDDFAAMLDYVDAVVVATPMNLHVPQSLLALQAGKDVLSEVTAASLPRRMLAAARRRYDIGPDVHDGGKLLLSAGECSCPGDGA